VTAAPRRQPWLMVVSDRARLCAAAGRPAGQGVDLLSAQAAAAAAAGVSAFQLREPDLDARSLLSLTSALAEIAGGRMRILVNDRADVAAAAGVALHLRSVSMPAARLRTWLPPATWIMRAVHDRAEIAAAGPVDAVLAGTVRMSASKPGPHPLLGIAGLAAVAAAAPVPVVAIGGLSAVDWPAVEAAGAAGRAAIGMFLPRRGESVADGVARAVAELIAVVDSPGGLSRSPG
jgi:thiamine-phosphate diphosphorylase